jgi:hypothetical protein
MNIAAILKVYEDSQSTADAARLEALNQERLARAFNGRAIQTVVRNILEPVMNQARADIIAAGWPCEVEVTQSKDSYSIEGLECAVGIRLKVGKDKTSKLMHSYIGYEGRYEAQSMIRKAYVDGGESPKASGPMALEILTKERAESEMEDFFKKVFVAH